MRVGTSIDNETRGKGAEDHPHACGDKVLHLHPHSRLLGSSPCVWGQELRALFDVLARGIIPMRVGTSITYHLVFSTGEDHPHACGDKNTSVNRIDIFIGSSPCVWGQVNDIPDDSVNMRIIPMRVGTSSRRHVKTLFEWDHPHACGDKSCR